MISIFQMHQLFKNDELPVKMVASKQTRNHYYTPPLPTSVQPISITKTLLIVPTKNEKDHPLDLFIGKLLIKFQNILRNTTQVIIRHRVKILFSVISSPITLERQK
jgi:glycine cleavage system protein P-like pyridoxal-binding family